LPVVVLVKIKAVENRGLTFQHPSTVEYESSSIAHQLALVTTTFAGSKPSSCLRSGITVLFDELPLTYGAGPGIGYGHLGS